MIPARSALVLANRWLAAPVITEIHEDAYGRWNKACAGGGWSGGDAVYSAEWPRWPGSGRPGWPAQWVIRLDRIKAGHIRPISGHLATDGTKRGRTGRPVPRPQGGNSGHGMSAPHAEVGADAEKVCTSPRAGRVSTAHLVRPTVHLKKTRRPTSEDQVIEHRGPPSVGEPTARVPDRPDQRAPSRS